MQRYSLRQGKMRPAPEGKYVLYKDMESLKTELAEAVEALFHIESGHPDARIIAGEFLRWQHQQLAIRAGKEAAKGGSEK